MLYPNWPSADIKAFWALRGRQSFWWFAKEVYNIDGNPLGGWLVESVHKPFCDWFQKHVEEWEAARRGGADYQKHLMVMVMREFGKTTLLTDAGMLWLTLRNPELSIYLGSENLDKAASFLTPIAKVLEGKDHYQRFTELYGNWYDKDNTWNNTSIVHNRRKNLSGRAPSFGTWGVRTGLTSFHPDVLCFDDPTSDEVLEKDQDWFTNLNGHIASLIPVLKSDGLRIFIGTPYGDGDHLREQIRKHGIATLTGQKMDEFEPRTGGLWHVFHLPGKDPAGEPTFPKRWPKSRMDLYERENSQRFYSQIMLSPSVGGHMPLSREQLDRCWVERKDVPSNLRISLHIDTAFKYKDRVGREDESVIQVWGHSRDRSGVVYYLEGYGSSTWSAQQFNDKLVSILQRLRKAGRWPYILTDELESFGKGGTWELTLQSWCHAGGIPCPPVTLLNRQGRVKLRRITAASSYWVEGQVKLTRNAPGVDRLVDQMLKIGYSKHDDWSDPAADVFDEKVYQPMGLNRAPRDNDQPGDEDLPFDSVLKGQSYSSLRGDLHKSMLRERFKGENDGYI